MEGKDKPVDVGDVYEVKIEDTGKRGDGVAKVNGFVIFVPEAEKGDKVLVKIVSVRDTYAIGRIVEI
ncbi:MULTISPECIES: TRAM domain-containing protein [unclassified Methanopyrus]|uniref:TRAM domain-containing protein n=1 Tax=Methanopyrus sp. SNP6 TaxID=1937005 RepID=UPI0011E5ACC6|nr:TRAM domain-containing protein [Methanopyrus sp. SNP6]